MSNHLHKSTTKIDQKTGLPEDYHSLIAGYDNLVRNSAIRAGIPPQDVEDAMQEVQLKFWMKDGLNYFDPEKKTKFASLYRNWTALFMLQERDKVIKQTTRYEPVDDTASYVEKLTVDISEGVVSDDAVSNWLGKAVRGLSESNRQHLLPVLMRCAKAAEDNTTVTRADIVEVTDCNIRSATKLLQELRYALIELGLGMESIYA